MYKGGRNGRPRRQTQYNARSQDCFGYRSRSPIGNRGNQSYQIFPYNDNQYNDYESVSFNRFDEDERRFYESIKSVHDPQLWQNYREKVEMIEAELLEEMTYYRENPEKHPKYELEWKEYWNGRTDELIRTGEDPINYDIKVEFFSIWDMKLRELYQDIFQKQKGQLRQELMPLYSSQSSKLIGDHLSSQKESVDIKLPILSQDKLKSTYDSKPVADTSVIPILRHLSALENHLGSLGPKVVELLSKALLLEKSTGASTDLLNEENCLILETVMEKLKGILQAGLMKKSMIIASETAIGNITNLLSTIPFGKNMQLNFDEKSSFCDKKSVSDEKPHSVELKSNHDDRKTNVNERKYHKVNEGQCYPDGKNFYRDINKPCKDQSKSHDNERELYSQRGSLNDFSSATQNKRAYKVSEISSYTEKLKSLSHLSFVEKTAMAQEIASSLLLQKQTDIKEGELLELINTYLSKKDLRGEFSSANYFDKQTAGAYQQRSNDNSQSSLAYDDFPRTTSKIPSLFDTPAHVALDSLYRTNQSDYSPFRENTTRFYTRGDTNISSGFVDPANYPLHFINPYQSNLHRKY